MGEANQPIASGGYFPSATSSITHVHLNSRYSMTFEQAASSTKSVLGFKVVAQGDNLEEVKKDIARLLEEALEKTKPVLPQEGGTR